MQISGPKISAESLSVFKLLRDKGEPGKSPGTVEIDGGDQFRISGKLDSPQPWAVLYIEPRNGTLSDPKVFVQYQYDGGLLKRDVAEGGSMLSDIRESTQVAHVAGEVCSHMVSALTPLSREARQILDHWNIAY